MLFRTRFHGPIARGEVTCTVRRWRRPQAKPGGIYRVGDHTIEVTGVERLAWAALTPADAAAAGFDSLTALRNEVDRGAGTEGELHRIRFRPAGPYRDPRAALREQSELSDAEIAAVVEKLRRMDDRAQAPWTRNTLRLIAEQPGTRAADLAHQLGRETQPFKADVRKLKAQGLTISLETGYRLSPRGEAVWRVWGRE